VIPRRALLPLALLAAVGAVAGCVSSERGAARCRADQRLGIVAQSVPAAAYVPCLDVLPAGWEVRSFDVDDAGTDYVLRSDRDPHDVRVELRDTCDVTDAVPVAPHDTGVRSYQRTESIAPRYAGWLFDVFPGGCVTYRFDFERGEHIRLLDELEQALNLFSRRELRQALDEKFGITLD
jgi:hypothetical protein